MDIGSKSGYPAGALSNFAPHPFTLDGMECASMEGFLQSLKFSGEDMQRHVCTLVGGAAKRKGAKKNWQRNHHTLHWKGQPINRLGDDYQELLDRAFAALAENDGFRRALLATGNAVLIHSIGKSNPKDTVLTEREFCSRLTRLRSEMEAER